MISRRTLLQAIGFGAAAFVIPGQRRNIDLMEFCGEKALYDLSLPHQVGDYTFASDGRMAVRVRPILADALHHKSDRIPPFSTLPWDSKLIWRPMPKLEPIVATKSPCPTCDGSGYWPDPPEEKIVGCASCFGEGCADCDDRGGYAEGYYCSMCRGKGYGKFPALVKIGDCYADVRMFRKFHALGGEYAVDTAAYRASNTPIIRFRFADGDGMLMPIKSDYAIERIEEEK